MFELKPLHADALARALEKANHYRLLNEPRMAESICLDLLGAEPDNQQALVTLIGLYGAGIFGGSISAILLNAPGTPASAATIFDGYPMAQQGQAERALGLGVMSSFVGGIISWGFLVMLARPIALLSTKFGPFEYFSLVLMALVLIASLGGKSISRSLFSGFLGILFSMPGIAAATGETRLTFGIAELLDGFKLLPVLIGLFAVNQIFRDIINIKNQTNLKAIETKGVSLKLKDFTNHWFNLIRSSVIGTWIGLLPGIGANIGSVTAYTVAKSSSTTPEKFGTGHDEGVVAGEAANNATIGGALIPLISMGLPGSVVEAVLLGALVIHGLQPGPRLFEEHPVMVYTIMGAMFLANIFMAVIMIFSMRGLAKISQIPRNYLLPVILIFCVIGSFALSNRLFDVWVMLGFGALGFILESKKIPLAPFVIGFVLGPIAEENLTTGLISSNGSWLPIVTRPIPLVFLLVALTMLLLPVLRKRFSKSTKPIAAE